MNELSIFTLVILIIVSSIINIVIISSFKRKFLVSPWTDMSKSVEQVICELKLERKQIFKNHIFFLSIFQTHLIEGRYLYC